MPDLNSVPASPHVLRSRRESSNQATSPPTSSSPSLNILPSNQSAVNLSSTSSLPSPQLTATHPVQSQPQMTSLEPGVGPGPGPLRHPRPLTAAELHLELEKEQEAVVGLLLSSTEDRANDIGKPFDSRTVPPSSRPECVRSIEYILNICCQLYTRACPRESTALRLRILDSHS